MKPAEDPSSPFFRDPNAVEWRSVKLYTCAEIVIEVCRENGLRCKLTRPELQSRTLTVEIASTAAEFREAQLEWLRRMTITLPVDQLEESLFT